MGYIDIAQLLALAAGLEKSVFGAYLRPVAQDATRALAGVFHAELG